MAWERGKCAASSKRSGGRYDLRGRAAARVLRKHNGRKFFPLRPGTTHGVPNIVLRSGKTNSTHQCQIPGRFILQTCDETGGNFGNGLRPLRRSETGFAIKDIREYGRWFNHYSRKKNCLNRSPQCGRQSRGSVRTPRSAAAAAAACRH